MIYNRDGSFNLRLLAMFFVMLALLVSIFVLDRSGYGWLALVALSPLMGMYLHIEQRFSSNKREAELNAAELMAAQDELRRNNELLKRLKDLQSEFLSGDNLQASFDKMLSYLLEITGSEYGFMGEVLHREDGAPYLKTLTLTNIAWDDDTQALYDKYAAQGMEFGNLETLFGYTLRTQKPIITNDPAHDARRGGLPQGHPALNAFMGLPVIYNSSMLGMIGLANRKGGYDEALASFLTPFLAAYGSIIQNFRLRRAQLEYEANLTAAKEEAERAMLSKETFFTNLSHELRTPLALIVGPVSALQRGQLDEEQQAHLLEIIQQNSQKLLTLIEDILALSKVSEGRMPVSKQVINLEEFVRALFDMFTYQAEELGVKYYFDYQPSARIEITTDAAKLERIINNFLSNAFKFTPKGKSILVRVFTSAGKDKQTNINIEVEDTGRGIAASDLPHIFDRFYQAQGSGRTGIVGSGVGLALSRNLANLLGGDIHVCSQLDEGSSFMLQLPIEEADIKIQHYEERGTEAPPRPCLLLVEDNAEIRDFTANILRQHYKIITANNGMEALRVLYQQAAHVQLVVSDIMMPEMDGFQLVAQSKQYWPSIPFLFLTAKSDEKAKAQALQFGVDEYITKPFMVDELLASVRALLNNLYMRMGWAPLGGGSAAAAEAEADSHAEEIECEPSHQEECEEEEIIDEAFAENARKAVLERLDDTDYSVDDLARNLAVSKRQLYRFVKKNIGLTPLHFIKEVRLQVARQRLEGKDFKTLTDLCYAVGFGSLQGFTKAYVERFGRRPSDYK